MDPEAEMSLSKVIKSYRSKVDAFFKEDQERITHTNWLLVKPMSIVYLLTLVMYLVFVCAYQKIPTQTALAAMAVVIHSLFVAARMLVGDKESPALANGFIIYFAIEILVFSLSLSIVVFPREAALIFPLSLILMTQIYTLRPRVTLSIILAGTLVFLTISYHMKSLDVFTLDVIDTLIADITGLMAIVTSSSYKADAYEAQKALHRLSFCDDLTGLGNRHAFTLMVKSLEREGGINVGFAFLDMNNLKRINDSISHMEGDLAILKCRDLLLRHFDKDFLYRVNGDEFMVVEMNIKQEDFALKMESLKAEKAIAEDNLASVGYSWISACSSLTRLLSEAEASMYNAKKEFYKQNPGFTRRSE